MKISRNDFLERVYLEIETIRQKATKEEKDKLNFDDFNPYSDRHCIYGQMTGKCISKRAIELMPKELDTFVSYALPDCKNVLHIEEGVYYTYLETYIASMIHQAGVNKAILDYIKGNTNQLELE